MDTNKALSLVANAVLLIIQVWALHGIKKKRYIFKCYTYLQNFISAVASAIFVAAVVAYYLNYPLLLTVAKGVRYVATCGLVVTMFIFTFISVICRDDKNKIGSNDCKAGYNYRLVNMVLHYISPVLSVSSFLWFEKPILLTNSIWTGLAAIPSIIYWGAYFILTVTNKWDEPYSFAVSKSKVKNGIIQVAFVLFFAVMFIITSMLLWEGQ